jgi:uncharacterized protein (TIGR02679 family)
MSASADIRLQRLLGGERFASLRKRLRQRFERAPIGRPVEHLRIEGLNAEEHEVMASLLGRPYRMHGSLSFHVRLADAALQRAGIAASLREALEQLDGPIVELAAARQRAQAIWADIVDSCGHLGLASLLRAPVGLGVVRRLARQDAAAAAELCGRAAAVLSRLPANGITRSQLAAEVLGDAHALDDGQPLATVALAVLRRHASPIGEDEDVLTAPERDRDPSRTIERARDVWAAAGVLVNELARPALFLNVPAHAREDPLRGEPLYASLRSLLRTPPSWDVSGRDVYVCENPNLVAIAADRLGRACAPLVCTEGMPAAAQRTLLSQLSLAGARLRYHGDFDWPGLRIANHVMREHGAQPWRFGVADYLAAIQIAPLRGQRLGGKTVAASWDDALMPAMRRHGTPIAEEMLAASLLEDLKIQ